MIEKGILQHISISKPLPFKNLPYFYAFTAEFNVKTRVRLTSEDLTLLVGLLRGGVEVGDRVLIYGEDELEFSGCFEGSAASKFMIVSFYLSC